MSQPSTTLYIQKTGRLKSSKASEPKDNQHLDQNIGYHIGICDGDDLKVQNKLLESLSNMTYETESSFSCQESDTANAFEVCERSPAVRSGSNTSSSSALSVITEASHYFSGSIRGDDCTNLPFPRRDSLQYSLSGGAQSDHRSNEMFYHSSLTPLPANYSLDSCTSSSLENVDQKKCDYFELGNRRDNEGIIVFDSDALKSPNYSCDFKVQDQNSIICHDLPAEESYACIWCRFRSRERSVLLWMCEDDSCN